MIPLHAHLPPDPNIVGICPGNRTVSGHDTGERAAVVLVAHKHSLAALAPWQRVPRQLGALPTDVVEVGDIAPLSPPAMPGNSILATGRTQRQTLGMIYRMHGRDYALTTWHGASVVAQENPAGHEITDYNGRRLGHIAISASPFGRGGSVDACAIQLDDSPGPKRPARHWHKPGPMWDRIADTIGRVWRPVPCGWPHHHAAYDADLRGTTAHPRRISDAHQGDLCWKIGQKTGNTLFRVFSTQLSVRMQYFGRPVIMHDQLALVGGPERIVAAGDSGAVVMRDMDAVGLLFAGAGTFAVASPLRRVFQLLHDYIGDE